MRGSIVQNNVLSENRVNFNFMPILHLCRRWSFLHGSLGSIRELQNHGPGSWRC